jgi:protein-tyrosine phosphatase
MTTGRKLEVRLRSQRVLVIDLHSHLLPGIDDGASDLDESLAMARAAVDGGVEQIVATPHVSATYPNDPLRFAERVAEVQAALDRAGIPLRVHKGAEVSHLMLSELSDEALRAGTLGDGDYVLLEPPLSGPAPFIDRMADELQRKGFKVLLAHPERIAAFNRNIDVVAKLVETGCVTSITAGSLAGRFGGSVKRFTQELLARGLVHNLASDAHDAQHRSPALRPELDAVVAEIPELEGWLDYLTVETPRAILAGEVPSGTPPVIESKRGFLDRLRGR